MPQKLFAGALLRYLAFVNRRVGRGPAPGREDRATPHTVGMRLIELSHVITDQMVTYPGLPGPEMGEFLTFEQSHEHYTADTEFTIGRITLVSNTRTYLDPPAHRGRQDLSELPLQGCAVLPAVVVDCPGTGTIGVDLLDGLTFRGTAVLLRTGWDRHWGTPEYGAARHPRLGEPAAQRLVKAGHHRWFGRHGPALGVNTSRKHITSNTGTG